MDFTAYQNQAADFAIYPPHARPLYALAGLISEVGEIGDLIKKAVRPLHSDATADEIANATLYLDRKEMRSEIGDALWYLSDLATSYNLTMEECARDNLTKLEDRRRRGTIHAR